MNRTPFAPKRCPHGCGSTLTHRRDCPKFKEGKRLAQNTQGLQRTHMKRKSKKREIEDRVYHPWVAELRKSRPYCEYPQNHQCIGRSTPHHIWTLGQGGPRIDEDNVILLCILKHDWCHAHPLEAAELGMLGRDAYEARALEATV